MIIDFHTHTFPSNSAARIVSYLSGVGHVPNHTDGSPEGLSFSMKEAGIDYSVNLPVMTRVDQVTHVHDGLIRDLQSFDEKHIITFGGLHPDFENYRAEIARLKANGIKGVKLHPAYSAIKKDINDPKYLRLIDAVSEAGLITLVHAGLDIGYLDHNYASVEQILDVIEQVHPERFVLAHMGGWQSWDDVEKYLAGAPVWLDTSFSIGALDPSPDGKTYYPYTYNLSPEVFVRLCKKHGVSRILFGSDSPWSDQKEYVKRISEMSLSDPEKGKILGENARLLLNLPLTGA